jgi:UDPglucose 6-dehydrogenase
MNTVTFVGGCGRLGLSLACVAADHGYNVFCADVNDQAVVKINRGECPITEPVVDELVARWGGKRLHGTLDTIVACAVSDIIFVIVPTPSGEDGAFSLKYVTPACKEIGLGVGKNEGKPTVVIVSTVMPGHTLGRIREQLEAYSHKKMCKGFHLVFSPEFIRQGSIVADTSCPDQVLIGECCEKGGEVVEEYYRSVVNNEPPFKHMSIVSAEIAKLGLNTTVVAKTSMANQIAWLCHNTPGADAKDVLDSIGADKRVGSKYFGAGTPVGGPCFCRDARAFAVAAEAVYTPPTLARAIDEYIDIQVGNIGRMLTVGLLGLTYKPGVDIVEESQAVKLAKRLGANQVVAYDPRVVVGYSVKSLEALVRRADVIYVMVQWSEFKRLEELDLRGKLVYDLWGMLDEDKLNCAKYVRFGRGQ